ncbi:ParA family protein [Micromonospora aurantiaca]|uniref:ParA family protein n=1 Tax=Micromonospora aurantiaca (nom. illeg.) TaxID=47850 RepID=UPI003446EB71
MSHPTTVLDRPTPLSAVAVIPSPSEPEPLRLAIANLKGGTGKSTSAWMLLCELTRRGHRVLGIDADPVSQTLADCYRTAIANGYPMPFEVLSWPSATGLVDGVRMAAAERRATAVVIDVGGDGGGGHEATAIFDQAALYAEKLLIPAAPTPPDLRRVMATFLAAARVNSLSPIDPHVLLVRYKTTARSEAAGRLWLAELETPWGGVGLPVLDAGIPDAEIIPRLFGHLVDDTGRYADVVDELYPHLAAERTTAA